MKLYHGTTEEVAELAVVEGLRPRRETTTTSNWDKAPSHPSVVYLSDAYPMYFALAALKFGVEGVPTGRAAVLEIDSTLLKQGRLVPDEDVLEQAGRGHDRINGTMLERTAEIRKKLWTYRGTDVWQVSLSTMGTCGYFGVIPPAAITRVALVDIGQQGMLGMDALDAQISILNYRVCANKYKALTAHIFGDEFPLPEDDTRPLIPDYAQYGRGGIDVFTAPWGK